MNTEKFTGKAQAYAVARPSYPAAALEYIRSLVPTTAVFADIGAGTGKLTVLLAQYGYELFAVEPNTDMRGQLALALSSFGTARIVAGTAEVTTLPDHCVDAITCAQALHWFDPEGFRAECRRIGKPGALTIAVYNNMSGNNGNNSSHSKTSSAAFFNNPTIRQFSNPIAYNRENWLQYMTSHSHDPLPSDSGYEAHMNKMNQIFDQENVDGLLHREIITDVYWEKLD